jgi:hypothetical protein
MPAFQIAFRAAPPDVVIVMGDPPTALTLTRANQPLLRVELNPAALALTAAAHAEVWHCHRWADATVKPLPPASELLSFYRGDAYIAVSPITDGPALARLIHLRDYFNAEKMAEAVWAHLLAPLAVIVIEAR